MYLKEFYTMLYPQNKCYLQKQTLPFVIYVDMTHALLKGKNVHN